MVFCWGRASGPPPNVLLLGESLWPSPKPPRVVTGETWGRRSVTFLRPAPALHARIFTFQWSAGSRTGSVVTEERHPGISPGAPVNDGEVRAGRGDWVRGPVIDHYQRALREQIGQEDSFERS